MAIDKQMITDFLEQLKIWRVILNMTNTLLVPVEVLLALRFLATRSLETPAGDKTDIKQSSTSNSLAHLLLAQIKTQLSKFASLLMCRKKRGDEVFCSADI